MKTILSIFLLHILITTTLGQTIIKGKVTNASSLEHISFATISVFKSNNNAFISSAMTNPLGEFSVEVSDNPNLYFLKITATGYTEQTLALKDTSMLEISLIKEAVNTVLDEVLVMGNKKAVSVKGDKIIYDIDQLGIGMARNGLEMLQQLPGLSLDKDENLKNRGSTGIQIMINGKKSMLQGDALREYIRSLRSEDIQAVEIIAQPSARYEASGTTGIMNIVLKRNTREYIGGSIYSNSDHGKYFGTSVGGRFFYNDDKWSVNASASYYKGKSFNDRMVNQTIKLENNNQRDLVQTNYWLPTTESSSLNFAVERKITKNQLISTDWKWNNSFGDERTTGKTLDYLNGKLLNEVKLTKENKIPTNQVAGSIFYNFTADSSATKVDAQMNYGYYKKEINGFQQNEFSNVDINKLAGTNQTKYTMFNTQVDWIQKISKPLEIELGSKFSAVEMNYFNRNKAVQGTNFVIPDSLMTNDFLYKEKLTAAYAQFSYTLDHWNFMAGLRMENYHYSATSFINNQTNKGTYTSWFPSASVNYKQDNNQYRFSYSKRIQRPSYLSLNPYFQYLDAFSIEKGNPDLKPQMYHSFEANYIYKNALSLGLYGYLYTDGFVQVMSYQPVENYNIYYTNNASNGSNYGISVSYPYEIGKWWSMQYSINAFLESEKSTIKGYSYDGAGHGYEFTMYHRFTLPKQWVFTWNGFFNGRNKTPIGFSPMVYDFSTSLRKSILQEKMQIVLGCSNILRNNKWNNISTVNNVTTHWINKWATRRFYLQVTYRFGGTKEKKVKNTSLNEEQRRM